MDDDCSETNVESCKLHLAEDVVVVVEVVAVGAVCLRIRYELGQGGQERVVVV